MDPQLQQSQANLLDGLLNIDRDWADDPYWRTNKFWPKFLRHDYFDHTYLIEIFKLMAEDCKLRSRILKCLLGRDLLIFNEYAPTMSEDTRLREIRKCIHSAKQRQDKAFITWEYPGLIDENGHPESHVVMLIYDPSRQQVIYIDSRGLHFFRQQGPIWQQSYQRLRALFLDCEWIDAILTDKQGENFNDNFCQCWSLILCITIEQQAAKCLYQCQDKLSVNTYELEQLLVGYRHLIDFWQQIIRYPEFLEDLYYEIFRQTHDGTGLRRHYHRYFSTLESLVTGSNGVYYPACTPYWATGYTFIEDFVLLLDENMLEKILA